jgi:polyadenylate-binding protein
VKKSERSTNNDDSYTNLYMKNLDDEMTEELIKLKFSKFGTIVSVKIMRRDDGSSQGFGFVSFQSPDSAKRAKEAMNGLPLGMVHDWIYIFIFIRKKSHVYVFLCPIFFC